MQSLLTLPISILYQWMPLRMLCSLSNQKYLSIQSLQILISFIDLQYIITQLLTFFKQKHNLEPADYSIHNFLFAISESNSSVICKICAALQKVTVQLQLLVKEQSSWRITSNQTLDSASSFDILLKTTFSSQQILRQAYHMQNYFITCQLFTDSPTEVFSSIITIFLFVFSLAYPPFILILSIKLGKDIGNSSFVSKLRTLMTDLDFSRQSVVLYQFLFLIRRLVFAIICVSLTDFPFGQIMLFNLSTLFIMMYIYYSQPYLERFLNGMEMFNEMCILLISYHLFSFTDFLPDMVLQYKIGFSVIGITSLNILVNSLVVIIQAIKELVWIVLKIIRRKRAFGKVVSFVEQNQYLKRNISSTNELDLYVNFNQRQIQTIDESISMDELPSTGGSVCMFYKEKNTPYNKAIKY